MLNLYFPDGNRLKLCSHTEEFSSNTENSSTYYIDHPPRYTRISTLVHRGYTLTYIKSKTTRTKLKTSLNLIITATLLKEIKILREGKSDF